MWILAAPVPVTRIHLRHVEKQQSHMIRAHISRHPLACARRPARAHEGVVLSSWRSAPIAGSLHLPLLKQRASRERPPHADQSHAPRWPA